MLYETPIPICSFHVIQCNKGVTWPNLATHNAVMNVFAIVTFALCSTAHKTLISRLWL